MISACGEATARRREGTKGRGCVLAVVLALVGGCTVGPDYRAPEIAVPERFGEPTTRPTTRPVVQWWKTFGDPVLDQLIEQAVQSNLDLKIARSRVREARALRRIVASDRWPTVNGSGSYSRSKGSENVTFGGAGALGDPSTGTGGSIGAGGVTGTPFDIGGFFEERDLWQAGFDASWELDVFGGVRRSIEAADADVAAAEEGWRDVLVSLLAEVAANYVELRGYQQQIAVARRNVAAQEQTVELTRTRFQAGLTGELDVVRAQSQVSVTSATIPPLETAARRAVHRIAVLTGRWPGALAESLLAEAPLPAAPPVVPAGLPSELLRRRSDIRRSERELAAATARIGVATADLFPRFALTGALGLRSERAKNLFEADSNFWSIGPGFTLPLFDRGRIRANIEAQTARTEQARIAYESAVLRALEEVEDALVAYAQDRERLKLLADAVKANRRAVELANELYTRGLVDFLTVLEAQRSLYVTEEQLAGTERELLADLVALYKALGGGWEAAPEGTEEPIRAPGER